MRLSFEVHLHSCLSPCGHEDMTPANLAAMCRLAGIQVAALTDHNSCRNCPAFFRAAAQQGILPLCGMEVCTREEIHLVCLFPTLEGGLAFSDFVGRHLPPMENNPRIFGRQLLLDEEDRVVGEESLLLSAATDLPLESIPDLVAPYGGLCYPAHIDRPANSLLSQLGLWDKSLPFSLAEVSPYCGEDFFHRADLQGLPHIVGCDAHDLTAIPDAHQWLEVPQATAHHVIEALKKMN